MAEDVAKDEASHPEPPADHVDVDPPAVGGRAAPGLVRVLPSHARLVQVNRCPNQII